MHSVYNLSFVLNCLSENESVIKTIDAFSELSVEKNVETDLFFRGIKKQSH
jgi:hypothetical protein